MKTWRGWCLVDPRDHLPVLSTLAPTRREAWVKAALWIGDDHKDLYRWGYRTVRVQMEEERG